MSAGLHGKPSDSQDSMRQGDLCLLAWHVQVGLVASADPDFAVLKCAVILHSQLAAHVTDACGSRLRASSGPLPTTGI